jgi:hypothetical protein
VGIWSREIKKPEVPSQGLQEYKPKGKICDSKRVVYAT